MADFFGTNPTQATQAVVVDPQALELQRKRQLANLLTQQALTQQPQGQMVSGHYVPPSWTQNLANIAGLYKGQQLQKEADKEQLALAEQMRATNAQEAQDIIGALTGKSAVAPTYNYGNNEADQIATIATPGQAAVAPNPQLALAKALSARGTAGQALLPSIVKQAMPEEFKVGEGEVMYRKNPQTGQVETVAKGGEKYHAPTHIDLGDKVMIQYPNGQVQYVQKTKSGLQDLSSLGGIRGQFISEVRPHVETADAYAKVVTAPKTAAGDMSKIYGYMKILDPGTGVKEGEYATAANAGGIPTRIQSLYNRVVNGEKLTDSQRAEFDQAAGALVKSQKDRYKRIESHYTNIATKANIQPDLIISNPYEGLEIKSPTSNQPTMEDVKGTGRFNPMKKQNAPKVIDFNNLPQG